MKTEDAFLSELLNTVTAVPFAALYVLLSFCAAFWQTLARGPILAAFLRQVPLLNLYVQWLLCVPLGLTFKDSAFSPCCIYVFVWIRKSSFETVEEMKYLGIILTNQNPNESKFYSGRN
jgi:hypothetical protein